MPKTWLVQAILVTCLCFWPVGIAAIIHAAKVESLFWRGKHEESLKASASARKYVLIAFWIGIGVVALVFTVYFFIIVNILTNRFSY